MDTALLLTPLVRWDGLHLVFNLKMVERWLQRQLAGVEMVGDLVLTGAGDGLRLDAKVTWKGLRIPVALELAEIRLRHRRLGLRMRHLRPGGVPLHRGIVEAVLDHLDQDLVTVIRGQGIVIVDLRRWIPAEVAVSVRTVQATRDYLHLWLGPGSVHDLPGAAPLRLAPGPGQTE